MIFSEYKADFPYKGKAIYNKLYELHSPNIKTKKQKFAVNNLEKIFRATFRISAKIGFHEMSLRDLCRETGLSMGGIYSCIASKDIIAIMIKDMVKLVTTEIIENAVSQKNNNDDNVFHKIITNLIYVTEILQPWFYFLYFETRSLPVREQEDSKKIELLIVSTLEKLLKESQNGDDVDPYQYHFIATMLLAMIQERYLKPWKYRDADLTIEDYACATIRLADSAINA